jgi:hypothetical protein
MNIAPTDHIPLDQTLFQYTAFYRYVKQQLGLPFLPEEDKFKLIAQTRETVKQLFNH